ncbi:MAG: response regulator [Actinomycetales bacterium]
MIRVMLVDDHQLVRQAVGRAVDSEPDLDVVAQAGTIAEAAALIGLERPDVLVVDVSLPDGNGIELVRSTRESLPATGIVVLTMHADDETLLRALEAGASALVLKSSTLDSVVDAVRRSATAPDVFAAAGLAAAMRRRNDTDQPRLTPRESEVLVLLKDGLSVGQVARRLYMSESTVKTHIAKIYDKLGATNRAQALMAAIRQGLVATD